METIYFQTGQGQAPIPWYEVCRIGSIPATTREKLRIQASMLASYLSNFDGDDEAWTKSRPKLTQKATAIIQASTSDILGHPCLERLPLYQAKSHTVKSLISAEFPPRSRHGRWYQEMIWLISHTMCKGYALIAACVPKKRELGRVESVHLICYLATATEKALGECATLCETFLEGKRDVSREALLVEDTRSIPKKRQHSESHDPPSPSPTCAGSGPVSQIGDVKSYTRDEYWQRASAHAKRFFGFLCSLKYDEIPEILLLRMAMPMERWGQDGFLCSMDQPAIDPIVDDLSSGKAFDYVLLLLSIRLMLQQTGGFGTSVYTINRDIRAEFGQCEVHPAVTDWSRLVLVCHAFPSHWEQPWFMDEGRILLPQLQHAFEACPDVKNRVIEDPTNGYQVLLVLILSTKLPGLEWKSKAIDVVEDALAGLPALGLSNTNYLDGLLQLRKLELSSRFQDVSFGSFRSMPVATDPRLQAVHGMMTRYRAQRLIMEDSPQLARAYQELDTFTASAGLSSSSIMTHEFHLQDFMRGKILRWEGHFEQAARRLEGLIGILGHHFNETGCSLWSHYVGVLCELHQFGRAEHFSRHAIASFVHVQTQGMFSERQKRYRLLRLALAEALLFRHVVDRGTKVYEGQPLGVELKEAQSVYVDLDAEYQGLERRDWASRLEHLRVSLGRAVLAHLGEDIANATQLWQDLQVSARYCREHHQVTGFLEMVSGYGLCDLAARREDYNEAHKKLQPAKIAFHGSGREYWWTCVGTDFLDLVCDSLSAKGIISGINRR